MVSLHTFNLWSRTAEKLSADRISTEVILAHVPCQENADFCQGLNAEDFHTVVSYRNGQNNGKTENLGDEEYYARWIELVLAGNIQKIDSESQLAELKKGVFMGKKRMSVTIGIFGSEEDTSLQHLRIASEKLAGKYYLAYFINKNAKPSVTTYRSAEKQKRTDYSGKFDPATLMEFLTKSSLPSIIDITAGFSTDLLFHQKRPILILIGPEPSDSFVKLSARQDARKSYIFTRISTDSQNGNVKKCLEALGVEENESTVLILNKDRIHKIPTSKAKCPDHLHKLIRSISTGEADKVLSTKSAHPLRYLQVGHVNKLFGFEETVVLPDHTLFLDSDPFARHPPIAAGAGTGGCPFMQGGGATENGAGAHTEL
ncbi:unnamed protein product [Caenorhabditis sp. 36 PRJEB53466]|nr:unnamed protein product [Caenorhabditis sp. 36 PRJEB53466]